MLRDGEAIFPGQPSGHRWVQLLPPPPPGHRGELRGAGNRKGLGTCCSQSAGFPILTLLFIMSEHRVSHTDAPANQVRNEEMHARPLRRWHLTVSPGAKTQAFSQLLLTTVRKYHQGRWPQMVFKNSLRVWGGLSLRTTPPTTHMQAQLFFFWLTFFFFLNNVWTSSQKSWIWRRVGLAETSIFSFATGLWKLVFILIVVGLHPWSFVLTFRVKWVSKWNSSNCQIFPVVLL